VIAHERRAKAPPLPATEIVSATARLLHENKAEDVLALDLRELAAVADYFVIASGSSEQHVRALARAVERGLVEAGAQAWQKEGETGRRWILLDYVDVVIHIFHRETRDFYRLEKLWADAKPVELPHPRAGR
jgi:ribosome-associated protein